MATPASYEVVCGTGAELFTTRLYDAPGPADAGPLLTGEVPGSVRGRNGDNPSSAIRLILEDWRWH
ncbi:hypothetical protein GCM10023322_39010 [Rugosimonospora acidiphila]|uniref:Uncharacterized protein n=1 Tax=Rugosimonospora acidiphila TaxID=556531 RepID=A0ABP9RWD6_9ACTN